MKQRFQLVALYAAATLLGTLAALLIYHEFLR